MAELVIRGRRVVTPEGVRAASIHIEGGVIAAVRGFDDVAHGAALETVADDCVVMPGLVDTHVHINEPGRADWEGFATATRAAAAGGVTTLIEMPLNSIPATTTVAAYQEKVAAAQGKLHVDVGFWGGVVPGNTHELAGLWEAGAFGFKCFLVPSGVAEFEHVGETHLREAMPVLARMGATLLVHAELPGPIEKALNRLEVLGVHRPAPASHDWWLESRPPEAENEAIALMIRLCREIKTRVHIVHLSSSDALRMLQLARQEGLPVTVETCPHYLFFTSENTRGTEFKCAPPIRGAQNRNHLWKGLRTGIIDIVVTDHSPSPPEMKCLETRDFIKAWGGIASLQLSLSAVWQASEGRGVQFEQLAKWMCFGPARLAGLESKKGAISAGMDGDLVVWNPNESFGVDPAKLHHRHKVTPYADFWLKGVVRTTYLRGLKIYDSGSHRATSQGQVLRRGQK